MGLFEFFKKKKEELLKIDSSVVLYSPLKGVIIPIEEIPDEAFSNKMIGDGVGIIPTGNIIYAPCDAEVINIFGTNHAISFEMNNGLEILIHFGMDTVKLDGKGFKRIAVDGQSVKKGDPLVEFNLEYIIANAKTHKTPVIISNMDIVKTLYKFTGEVNVGDKIMEIKLK